MKRKICYGIKMLFSWFVALHDVMRQSSITCDLFNGSSINAALRFTSLFRIFHQTLAENGTSEEKSRSIKHLRTSRTINDNVRSSGIGNMYYIRYGFSCEMHETKLQLHFDWLFCIFHFLSTFNGRFIRYSIQLRNDE